MDALIFKGRGRERDRVEKGDVGVSDTGMVISLKLYMLLNKLELCYIHFDILLKLKIINGLPFFRITMDSLFGQQPK